MILHDAQLLFLQNCPLLQFPQTQHSIFYASLYSVASDRAKTLWKTHARNDDFTIHRMCRFLINDLLLSQKANGSPFFIVFWSHVKCENNIFLLRRKLFKLFGTAKLFISTFTMDYGFCGIWTIQQNQSPIFHANEGKTTHILKARNVVGRI